MDTRFSSVEDDVDTRLVVFDAQARDPTRVAAGLHKRLC